MPLIKFTQDEKNVIINKIQLYFNQELDQDIGQFDAEFLLDFFSEEVGAYYYNRALYDAQSILETKIDSITDAFYEIEKPTDIIR
jgi:uncharacterized protein (DUF2164 family)